MISLDKLTPYLPDYMSWRNANPENNITVLDYAGFILTPDILCAVVALLFPRTVSYRGRLFLYDHFSVETYELWMEKLDSQDEIQKVMNHVHISTIFQGDVLTEHIACQMAELIGAAWKENMAFKGLHVHVEGNDYYNASVTFFGEQRSEDQV